MSMGQQLIETGEYLSGVKIPGCKPKEAVRREYSIPLPMTEADGRTTICGSVDSQTFKVQYYLRCFVKHSSVFEIGQGNCIQFPLIINSKPGMSAAAEPIDMNFQPNGRTVEFDHNTDVGDCTFTVNKMLQEPPSSLKMMKVTQDYELDRMVYKERQILDFENDPLPMIGDEGYVCIGFNTGEPWPDHMEINEPRWQKEHTCQNEVAWKSQDDGLDYQDPSKSKMKSSVQYQSNTPTTSEYQQMPKEESPQKAAGSMFDQEDDDF